LRLFTDSVTAWYRKRQLARGLPDGETGAVTAIQRADSDLRLSPHVHTLFLDGVYSADRDGKGRMFHAAPAPDVPELHPARPPPGCDWMGGTRKIRQKNHDDAQTSLLDELANASVEDCIVGPAAAKQWARGTPKQGETRK
jgi:hypothetical protein